MTVSRRVLRTGVVSASTSATLRGGEDDEDLKMGDPSGDVRVLRSCFTSTKSGFGEEAGLLCWLLERGLVKAFSADTGLPPDFFAGLVDDLTVAPTFVVGEPFTVILELLGKEVATRGTDEPFAEMLSNSAFTSAGKGTRCTALTAGQSAAGIRRCSAIVGGRQQPGQPVFCKTGDLEEGVVIFRANY